MSLMHKSSTIHVNIVKHSTKSATPSFQLCFTFVIRTSWVARHQESIKIPLKRLEIYWLLVFMLSFRWGKLVVDLLVARITMNFHTKMQEPGARIGDEIFKCIFIEILKSNGSTRTESHILTFRFACRFIFSWIHSFIPSIQKNSETFLIVCST